MPFFVTIVLVIRCERMVASVLNNSFLILSLQRAVSTGASKEAVKKANPLPWNENLINQFKVFFYTIDNSIKNTIDTAFGGGIYPLGAAGKPLSIFLLILLISLWTVLLIRSIIGMRNDSQYLYYYHEDEQLFQKIFRVAIPIMALIPVVFLGIGVVQGSHIHHEIEKKQYQKIPKSAVQQSQEILTEFQQPSKKETKYFGKPKKEIVADAIANGNATSASTYELQKQADNKLNEANHYSEIEHMEPHFKLRAYKNVKGVSVLSWLTYGLLFSSILLGTMLIYHGNNARMLY